MKNSVRRGLFHPDDIKILGLSGSPGPMSAPLPDLSRKPSRPSLRHLTSSTGPSFGPASASTARRSHSRSPSFVGHTSSGSGSFGRSEARRIHSERGFDKYTEDDDEDYEDVFGKPNNGKSFKCLSSLSKDIDGACATTATEQPIQTLQLNTRLSNKSWVRLTMTRPEIHPATDPTDSLVTNSLMRKILLLR